MVIVHSLMLIVSCWAVGAQDDVIAEAKGVHPTQTRVDHGALCGWRAGRRWPWPCRGGAQAVDEYLRSDGDNEPVRELLLQAARDQCRPTFDHHRTHAELEPNLPKGAQQARVTSVILVDTQHAHARRTQRGRAGGSAAVIQRTRERNNHGVRTAGRR